jgi:hypothetical protein
VGIYALLWRQQDKKKFKLKLTKAFFFKRGVGTIDILSTPQKRKNNIPLLPKPRFLRFGASENTN